MIPSTPVSPTLPPPSPSPCSPHSPSASSKQQLVEPLPQLLTTCSLQRMDSILNMAHGQTAATASNSNGSICRRNSLSTPVTSPTQTRGFTALSPTQTQHIRTPETAYFHHIREDGRQSRMGMRSPRITLPLRVNTGTALSGETSHDGMNTDRETNTETIPHGVTDAPWPMARIDEDESQSPFSDTTTLLNWSAGSSSSTSTRNNMYRSSVPSISISHPELLPKPSGIPNGIPDSNIASPSHAQTSKRLTRPYMPSPISTSTSISISPSTSTLTSTSKPSITISASPSASPSTSLSNTQSPRSPIRKRQRSHPPQSPLHSHSHSHSHSHALSRSRSRSRSRPRFRIPPPPKYHVILRPSNTSAYSPTTLRHRIQYMHSVDHLRAPLVPLISVSSGQAHPLFPTTLLQYHLLTHEQLDDLARWYHQVDPPVDETFMYPAWIPAWTSLHPGTNGNTITQSNWNGNGNGQDTNSNNSTNGNNNKNSTNGNGNNSNNTSAGRIDSTTANTNVIFCEPDNTAAAVGGTRATDTDRDTDTNMDTNMDMDSNPNVHTNPSRTVDLETKRRRFGRFIGLKGCESPIATGAIAQNMTGERPDELARRMEREWRRALARAEEEARAWEKGWRGRW